MKPFKTLDEQIEILKNRKLQFADEEKAKRYLLNNNYYNVINYYSKFFMLNSPDIYDTGVSFESIVALHCFDKEIKSTLFKFIIEAEKHIKSVIAHRFSEKFQEDFSYLNVKNYGCSNEKILQISLFISSLSGIISSNSGKNKDNAINHYVKKHKNVPMWVLVNYMTFGQVSKFFSYLDDSLKNVISQDMLNFIADNININTKILFTYSEMESYIKNIVDLRNIIAHDNKLLDFQFSNNPKYHPEIHGFFKVSKNDNRQNLYNIFILLSCFLKKEQFAQLNNGLYKRIKRLEKQIPEIHYTKIIETLGFEKIEKMDQPN